MNAPAAHRHLHAAPCSPVASPNCCTVPAPCQQHSPRDGMVPPHAGYHRDTSPRPAGRPLESRIHRLPAPRRPRVTTTSAGHGSGHQPGRVRRSGQARIARGAHPHQVSRPLPCKRARAATPAALSMFPASTSLAALLGLPSSHPPDAARSAPSSSLTHLHHLHHRPDAVYACGGAAWSCRAVAPRLRSDVYVWSCVGRVTG